MPPAPLPVGRGVPAPGATKPRAAGVRHDKQEVHKAVVQLRHRLLISVVMFARAAATTPLVVVGGASVGRSFALSANASLHPASQQHQRHTAEPKLRVVGVFDDDHKGLPLNAKHHSRGRVTNLDRTVAR